MKQLLLVFIGGGFGSMSRFLIIRYLNKSIYVFPYGTFFVNVVGSLLMGLILGLILKSTILSETQAIFLATGFCGGFTTFSTFAYENYHFLKTGDFMTFFLYTTLSFVLGFAAVFLGMYLSKFA